MTTCPEPGDEETLAECIKALDLDERDWDLIVRDGKRLVLHRDFDRIVQAITFATEITPVLSSEQIGHIYTLVTGTEN